MRSQHFIGILAILVVGFGIKWLFFASPAAEAQPEPLSSAPMDVFQMQREIKNLPVVDVKDQI